MKRPSRSAAAAMVLMASALSATSARADVTSWFPFKEAVKRFQAEGQQNSRIIGGRDARIGDNPWQVAILHGKDPDTMRAQFCGGSSIAREWVVTAAHCVDADVLASDLAVVANVDRLTNSARRLVVTDIILHPKWNRRTGDSDLALLRVRSGPENGLGPTIQIAEFTKFEPSDRILISGWGVTESRPNGIEKLQAVTIPFVPLAKCTAPLAYPPYKLTINMFCAGETGADTCAADSGGPAVVLGRAKPLLAGVSSWGDGCGKVNKYGVYTKLAIFREWIADKVR